MEGVITRAYLTVFFDLLAIVDLSRSFRSKFIKFGSQLMEITQLRNYEIPEILLKSNFASLCT